MKRVLELLNKNTMSDREREKYIDRTANNIDVAIKCDEFFHVDFPLFLDVIKKTNVLTQKSAIELLVKGEEAYGNEIVRILPYINCDYDASIRLKILRNLTCIPLLRDMPDDWSDVTSLSDNNDKIVLLETEIEDLKRTNNEMKDVLGPRSEAGWICVDYKSMYNIEMEKNKELNAKNIELKNELEDVKSKAESLGAGKYIINFRKMYNNLRREFGLKKSKPRIWPDNLKSKLNYAMQKATIDNQTLIEIFETISPHMPEEEKSKPGAIYRALIMGDWRTVRELFPADISDYLDVDQLYLTDDFADNSTASSYVILLGCIAKYAKAYTSEDLGPFSKFSDINIIRHDIEEMGSININLEKYLEAFISLDDSDGIDYLLQIDPNIELGDICGSANSFTFSLLSFHCDIAKKYFSDARVQNHMLIELFIAAIKMSTDAADLMIEYGFDINCYTKSGKPGFFYCLFTGENAIIVLERMIQRGLDIFAVSIEGINALQYKKCKDKQLREYLMRKGLK